ncbi:DODA-type extradiol aromatic ring-opening family dioxygenase [Pseudobacteriovorax antillogorgiicola]|uniref:4,5-DOPA dioxygenase extradiol n=1 Tax=Pseudobacteriovorax antillogorgiicola TaxID=1513793 RepID=A0A1Y6BBC0_9BACT|nr:class III extradiol ring-cleavage dioxygenase [Pseudobacteriovorax antillogorgiicola]TCS57454.1 4,5-DOPA dioxygenase extradiol [Pseudobacteriovorax antillogorgiicola]SMF00852.1 4,5-DOPA dioxygenase extradiol [Pseudobacteriovorax antillogorgiicola]
MSKIMPTLFLSHESPLLWDTPSPAREFLCNLASDLERKPKGLIVVSAHWQEPQFSVSSAESPATIHDFGGFPPQYYDVQYQSSGSKDGALELIGVLKSQGLDIREDPTRGMDHGVWIPIGLMYPQGELPVISLSIKLRGSAKEHYQLGQALKPLRELGYLVVGSGTATHNLGAFFGPGGVPQLHAAPDPRVQAFSDWLRGNINDHEVILNYKKAAPYGYFNHPSPDHFLPLIVAMGAGSGDLARCIHHSYHYGFFAMTSFRWG